MRLPTINDYLELLNSCDVDWLCIDDLDIHGFIFTGSTGNSIFLQLNTTKDDDVFVQEYWTTRDGKKHIILFRYEDYFGSSMNLTEKQKSKWKRKIVKTYSSGFDTVVRLVSNYKDDNYVDLGLPSKLYWNSINCGASRKDEIGNYYNWDKNKLMNLIMEKCRILNNFDKETFFKAELDWFTDSKLKKFAQELIWGAGIEFFTKPASSSGKYHPVDERGEGGLIRHTRKVMYFTRENIRTEMYGVKAGTREADLMYIAALAHDIKKYGEVPGQHTVKDHPKIAVDYINKIFETRPALINKEDIDYISSAVLSHMGRWLVPNGFPAPTLPHEILLAQSDYSASRLEVSIKLEGDTEAVTYNTAVYSDIQDIKTPGDYILTFGKHKGKTITQVFKEDESYLSWIMTDNKDSFLENHPDLIHNVEKFLSNGK